MNHSTPPAPGRALLTEHSGVRLKRSITLNPAGMLPKWTLGAVISCSEDGAAGVVEFILDGKSIIVSFTAEQDLLEPARLPEGGLPKPEVATVFDSSAEEEEDEPPPAEKLHYYAFSFGHFNFVPEHSTQSRMDCVYRGFPENFVTARNISQAKGDTMLPGNCVLMSVSYLGHMTKEEFGFGLG